MGWDSYFFIYGYLPDADYVTQSAGRQIILVLTLLCYHLWLQIDFGCPCSTDRNLIHCYSYMVLPCFIIISIIVWNDKRIGRIFRYGCYHSLVKKRKCTGKFCLEFFIYILQAATSGFLWCGSVLVDGDWYVCCGTANSEELKMLACMTDDEISLDEKARKVNLKNHSMVIGLICILMTAFCSFILILPWNKWCTRRNHFRAMFEEALLEHTENILMSEMGKAAADAVKKSLLSLTSAAKTTTPANTKDNLEKVEKTEEEEKILLNLNVNWKEIACVADVLIESIPNNVSNNSNTVT